ncbi:transmembrane amino acid transporter protein-domain-containing protein [Gongronella butleri]|nr:transmembrane amino acid transporter protein-domain-containing protein [Gongronella butleri]
MERSLSIDLPVDQVAKVVKRHLVHPQPSPPQLVVPKRLKQTATVAAPPPKKATGATSTYNRHHLYASGAILDDIYKWTTQVEQQEQRRKRTQSLSLPRPAQWKTLKQPGGFRRHHVLSMAAKQGKRPPNFVTSSFVEFLCLYGHFGGEDLSDSDESSLSSTSDVSSLDSPIEPPHHRHTENAREQHRASNQQIDQEDDDNGHENDENDENDENEHSLLLPGTSSRYGAASTSTASTSMTPLPLPAGVRKDHAPLQYKTLQSRETMPLLSRSRPGQIIQGRATPGKAMFLLLKSFVTTGIMFLPKAFENGGLVFSAIAIIGWALVSLWSFLLLVETRLVIPASFSDMGSVLYGPKMRKAVLVAITLSQIGFVCAYMVFVAENLQALVLTFSKCQLLIPMHLLILAQSFAFIPLAMIRKIQRLSVFALIADVFIVIGLAYIFYYDIKVLAADGIADSVMLWNTTYFPLFLGTAAFTYEGIGLVIPITESMKDPKQFPMVLRRALFIITLLFVSMGAISYMTFGDHVQTIILLNLPSKDPVVSSIQTLYSLAICLSIPLQLFPAIRIMENGLFTTRSGKNNAVVKWQKNVFRVLVVFLCAWIGIVGSKDKLDKFVPLIGALFCIPLCFVFPPMFHLRAFSLPPARQTANYLLIVFGIACMVWVATSTLVHWNSTEYRDPVKQCILHRAQ